MLLGKRTFFNDKRSIHVKIDNEDHYNLKIFLMSKNLTMQDIFDEFAQLVVIKDKRAISILEGLCKKKIEIFLKQDPNKNNKSERLNKKKYYLSELETDALYNLINDNEDSDSSDNTNKENDLIEREEDEENI